MVKLKAEKVKFERYVHEMMAKLFETEAGTNVAIMHKKDADDLGVLPLDRVEIFCPSTNKRNIAILDTTETAVKVGELGLLMDIAKALDVTKPVKLKVQAMAVPASLFFIKKKLHNEKLSRPEISAIVRDLTLNRISNIELASFMTAVYIHGFDLDETVAMTKALVENGKTIEISKTPVVDKHCLPFETPVLIRESGLVKVVPIGELAEKGRPTMVSEGVTEYALPGIEALTFDDQGKTCFDQAIKLFEVKAPEKMVKITLQGNRQIALTDDHSLFILRQGRIENVASAALKEGDFVVVPKKINFQRKAVESLNLYSSLSHVSSLVVDNGNGLISLKCQGHFLPESIAVNADLMRLLGLYVSEGFCNAQGIFFNFGGHEEELVKECAQLVERVFKIKPTVNRPHKTAFRICLYNKLSALLFKHVKEIDCGDNALNKRIPPLVLNASEELQREFLKYYIKGDGYLRRGYECVMVTSSRELAIQLQYLLSFLGISASVSESQAETRLFKGKSAWTQKAYYIYAQAREIFGGRKKTNASYLNLIPVKALGEINLKDIKGWKLRGKFRRQNYVSRATAEKALQCLESEEARRFILSDLAVLKVKKIERVKCTENCLYDLKMNKFARFVTGENPLFVHNCIGGINGRTTMLVVPIMASEGYYMPKTSSRSITSAAGTADAMEVLAPVTLSVERIKEITETVGGIIAWGGAVELAPADDKIIKVEHPLALDPKGQIVASVMAKKASVGAKHVVIDLPVGPDVKVKNRDVAKTMAKKFIEVGKELDMKVEAVITDGTEPSGKAFGPALEARYVMEILEKKFFDNLAQKACELAGVLFELVGRCEEGKGFDLAKKVLTEGKALKKMQEIIAAQGGTIKSSEEVELSKLKVALTAWQDGEISRINVRKLSDIARIAGAPADKKAGVMLKVEEGDKVKKGDTLYEIYAENERKLEAAKSFAEKDRAVEMERIILEKLA